MLLRRKCSGRNVSPHRCASISGIHNVTPDSNVGRLFYHNTYFKYGLNTLRRCNLGRYRNEIKANEYKNAYLETWFNPPIAAETCSNVAVPADNIWVQRSLEKRSSLASKILNNGENVFCCRQTRSNACVESMTGPDNLFDYLQSVWDTECGTAPGCQGVLKTSVKHSSCPHMELVEHFRKDFYCSQAG